VSGLDPKPDIIIAADWSVHPRKRWRSTIVRDGDGWVLHPAEPVGPNLLRDAIAQRNVRSLIGFDFPIGVPHEYAQIIGVSNFDQLLSLIATDPRFAAFASPASTLDEVQPTRPFFPSGNAWKGYRDQLATALEVTSRRALLRGADRASKSATPLFALGTPQQVGRAAVDGWKSELLPNRDRIRLWPFGGNLATLNRSLGVTVVEIYPAIAGKILDLKFKGKKSVQANRRSVAGTIALAAQRLKCRIDGKSLVQIESGFPEGDDAFDACIGALGMLEVVIRYSDADEPPKDVAAQTEGWILGVR
jgi:hypothetical protein